jgi:hypothetical protein
MEYHVCVRANVPFAHIPPEYVIHTMYGEVATHNPIAKQLKGSTIVFGHDIMTSHTYMM